MAEQLDGEKVLAIAQKMASEHARERLGLDVLRRYATGKQPMPMVIPPDAPNEVKEMARISRINLIAIVLNAMVESLYVDNFRAPEIDPDEMPGLDPEQLAGAPGEDDDPLADIWRTWQANRFDRGQGGLYRIVFTYGYGYVVGLPGESLPVVRAVSPRKMIAWYDDDDPDWPVYVLETRRRGYRLIDTWGVYTLTRDRHDKWEIDADAPPAAHGLDYCPVVRYTPFDDLDLDDEPEDMAPYPAYAGRSDSGGVQLIAGEVAPLMTLQDQSDLTTFALKAAEWYSAFRQRWIVGWTPEGRQQKIKSGASQLWTFEESPDDVRIGEFTETTLNGYLESRESTAKFAATLSQTPVHELIGELVNLSAEALAAAEAGRDRKVMLAKTSLGEGHEQLTQLIGDYLGIEVPDDVETIWRDTSARAFGAIVDGLGKLAQMLQIPPEVLWERIPGVTRQDVRVWKAKAAEGNAIASLTGLLDRQASALPAADPAPAPEPGAGTSGLILPPGSSA